MASKDTAKVGTPERAEMPVSAAVLDGLAVHARAAGTTLLLLHADGTVAYHDAGAGLFFERYAIPALRVAELHARKLREHVRQMSIQSRPQLLDVVPGVLLAAVPFVDRRQVR